MTTTIIRVTTTSETHMRRAVLEELTQMEWPTVAEPIEPIDVKIDEGGLRCCVIRLMGVLDDAVGDHPALREVEERLAEAEQQRDALAEWLRSAPPSDSAWSVVATELVAEVDARRDKAREKGGRP